MRIEDDLGQGEQKRQGEGQKGELNEATGPQQGAVGDYDERDEIVRSRIGWDPRTSICLSVLLECKSGTISLGFEALKLEHERSAEPEKGYCRGRDPCGNWSHYWLARCSRRRA